MLSSGLPARGKIEIGAVGTGRLHRKNSFMKALVYVGLSQKALQERPKPVLVSPTDAIVRMMKSTICGTDLHILKGHVPTCRPGRILGQEGVGVIEETGSSVMSFRKGDRVLISCVTACAKCEPCRRQMFYHCATGGWILGNTIDGTQAEFVRIPHADTSLHHIPEGVDDEALVMLSDMLPTGFECGLLNGKIQPGGTVAIVGAGPIGLAALLTAQFHSPSKIIMVDLDDDRLEVASRFGATAVVNGSGGKARQTILALTNGRGVDTAIEAVGVPATVALCQTIIAPGGTIAHVGAHGTQVDPHIDELWDSNTTITSHRVEIVSKPMLLRRVNAPKIDPTQLVTHRFKLDQIVEAYEAFKAVAPTKALKVIIEASGP